MGCWWQFRYDDWKLCSHSGYSDWFDLFSRSDDRLLAHRTQLASFLYDSVPFFIATPHNFEINFTLRFKCTSKRISWRLRLRYCISPIRRVCMCVWLASQRQPSAPLPKRAPWTRHAHRLLYHLLSPRRVLMRVFGLLSAAFFWNFDRSLSSVFLGNHLSSRSFSRPLNDVVTKYSFDRHLPHAIGLSTGTKHFAFFSGRAVVTRVTHDSQPCGLS